MTTTDVRTDAIVIRWSTGGEADLVSIRMDAIELRSSVPAPPGARIEGTLAQPGLPTLRVKVHGCRRQASGDYVVTGRPIDLSRALRERLEAASNAREPSG
ncbi:MAG: hypothetical protein ABSC94_21325 [Polyangiaceae bacterium]|jgi:hypothetical protein